MRRSVPASIISAADGANVSTRANSSGELTPSASISAGVLTSSSFVVRRILRTCSSGLAITSAATSSRTALRFDAASRCSARSVLLRASRAQRRSRRL